MQDFSLPTVEQKKGSSRGRMSHQFGFPKSIAAHVEELAVVI